MANEKKTSRKKFRVAVSGSTVDGREISPVHLREAAENFNPDVYADLPQHGQHRGARG